MSDTTTPTPQPVLDLELHPDNDSGQPTIRGYLLALLRGVWSEGEGFSGKRPFGNSSWEYDLYDAIVRAGYVKGTFDSYGNVEEFDKAGARELIDQAIDALAARPVEGEPLAGEDRHHHTIGPVAVTSAPSYQPEFVRHVALDLSVKLHAELGIDDDHEDLHTAAGYAAFITDGTVPERARDEPFSIVVRRPDDDHLEVVIDGNVVAEANHDEHGWSGMDAVEKTAVAVARALGVEIQDGDGE